MEYVKRRIVKRRLLGLRKVLISGFGFRPKKAVPTFWREF